MLFFSLPLAVFAYIIIYVYISVLYNNFIYVYGLSCCLGPCNDGVRCDWSLYCGGGEGETRRLSCVTHILYAWVYNIILLSAIIYALGRDSFVFPIGERDKIMKYAISVCCKIYICMCTYQWRIQGEGKGGISPPQSPQFSFVLQWVKPIL